MPATSNGGTFSHGRIATHKIVPLMSMETPLTTGVPHLSRSGVGSAV